jgi:transposase
MSKRNRRNHAPAFKTKVALAAVRIADLAKRFDVHPGQITAWKDQPAGAYGACLHVGRTSGRPAGRCENPPREDRRVGARA